MSEELKRCPFCGANPHRGLTKVEYDQLHGDAFQRFRIWCPHGCASAVQANRELAYQAWNKRSANRESFDAGWEYHKLLDASQARLSEAVKVLEEAAGKIDMQDVRLAVGEGNLTARDIINGVNAVLSMRRARSQAFLATIGEENE